MVFHYFLSEETTFIALIGSTVLFYILFSAGKTTGIARGEAKAPAAPVRREEEEQEEGESREGEQEEEEGGSRQPLHITRERSLKSITNWWRSSLEAGPTPPSPAPGKIT